MSLEEMIEAAVERGVRRVLEERLPRAEAPAELLTVQQAAELAKVSPETIHHWLDGGLLNRYGSGRVVRVRRDELLNVRPKAANPEATPRELALKLLGPRR